MMTELSLREIKKEYHGSLQAYMTGFVACFLLTSTSFLLVALSVFSYPVLVCMLITLALTQAVAQLLFFLHLGREDKPRWETLVFYFMLLLLLIIVIGTLWIMYDLDVRTMSNMPMEMMHD